MEKKDWNDPVEKDDLVTIAQIINSLKYLCGDMLDKYFWRYKDPCANKEESMAIAWDFKRYGAYMSVIDAGVAKIETELERLNIHILKRSYNHE